jgi:hypothetical protein
MDPVLLQAKIELGQAKAARVLGTGAAVYRPDARQPLIPALDARYTIAALTAWFNPDPNLRQVRPAPADKPLVYAAVDRTLLEAGDYLIDAAQNTWFVGSVQPLLATGCVRCNRAFTLTRAVAFTGLAAYGGNAPGAMARVLTAWPGFIAARARGVSPEERLPGDTKLNLVTILLPPTAGAQILPNDVLLDDQAEPMRYTVSIAQATDWGWTVDAYYAGA